MRPDHAATTVNGPVSTGNATHDHANTDDMVQWLQEQFAGWDIQRSETKGWGGEPRDMWVARRDGHHPQAALTAGKLFLRLDDYLSRESLRSSN